MVSVSGEPALVYSRGRWQPPATLPEHVDQTDDRPRTTGRDKTCVNAAGGGPPTLARHAETRLWVKPSLLCWRQAISKQDGGANRRQPDLAVRWKRGIHEFQPTRACFEAMAASCRNHRFYGGGKQYRSRTGAQIGGGRIVSGDQACVGALEYEKPTSPERGGAFRPRQFWTLLGVLYLLVPSVPPETNGKGRISNFRGPPLSSRA